MKNLSKLILFLISALDGCELSGPRLSFLVNALSAGGRDCFTAGLSLFPGGNQNATTY